MAAGRPEPSLDARKALRTALAQDENVTDDQIKGEDWVTALCSAASKAQIEKVACDNQISIRGRKDEIMQRIVERIQTCAF